MKKTTRVRVRRQGSSLPQKIRNIKNGQQSCIVSFIMHDGSVISETLNERFLERRRVGEIITDLYAITHDKGAKTFKI